MCNKLKRVNLQFLLVKKKKNPRLFENFIKYNKLSDKDQLGCLRI